MTKCTALDVFDIVFFERAISPKTRFFSSRGPLLDVKVVTL